MRSQPFSALGSTKSPNKSLNKIIQNNILSSGSVNVVGQFSFREMKLGSMEQGRVHVPATGVGEAFLYIFCYGEDLMLSFQKIKNKKLLSHQCALYHDQYGCGFFIDGKGKRNATLWVIEMTYMMGRGDGSYKFFLDFKKGFHKYLSEEGSIFIGKPIPNVLAKLQRLDGGKKENLSEILRMKAAILDLFGRKLERLQRHSEERNYGTLTVHEFAQINMLSSKIWENPAYSYTVLFLCRQTGLSPGKLQEGFKSLYNRTVMEYVRDVRLEKATELMQNTDLNISEIVYSIGFTSRSYFSKIFKRKYKCSPSYYMEILKSKGEMG